MTYLINPSQIRFIKLGEAGKWEEESIESDKPVIRLGYESGQHKESLAGNWDVVYDYWFNGHKPSTTNHIRQIRDFYEADEDTLWITFYKRKLYWCFVEKDVIELEDGSRVRYVKGQWSDKDINGKMLFVDGLDGRLTSTQGYRGTICGLSNDITQYLIRKINGQSSPEVIHTNKLLTELTENIKLLINKLNPKDFELLVDLTFSRLGWQRYSVLGKTAKDIDLDVYLPSANKRAFVQIKSKTNKKQILDYIEKYKQYENYQEFYFIYHSYDGDLIEFEDKDIHLIDGIRLAQLVINAGLIDWLLSKCL